MKTKKILERTKVLELFFDYGGTLIDSSPMYGTSERVIGKCLSNIEKEYNLFSATKVWTPNTWHGVKQLENSEKLWKVKNLELMQVHNLVNYENHLENLFQFKHEGRIKYVGITTSHGWRHEKTLNKASQTATKKYSRILYLLLRPAFAIVGRGFKRFIVFRSPL